jgi:hypothetical protein
LPGLVTGEPQHEPRSEKYWVRARGFERILPAWGRPGQKTKAELDADAESHGWTLEGISIIELAQIENAVTAKSQNTLFQPAEVELNNLSKLLLEQIAKINPVPRAGLAFGDAPARAEPGCAIGARSLQLQ